MTAPISQLAGSLADDRECSLAHGGKIQGLNLQSYLFFGSANRLYQHVKALLSEHPECRYLVFDFRLVTGINSSAAHSFAQIKRVAQDPASAGARESVRRAEKVLRRASSSMTASK